MTNTYVIGDSIDAGDSFCGGGGASQGLEAAGVRLRFAANHDAVAIATHGANHPDVDHYHVDLLEYDIAKLPRVDMAHFSPSCKHHSQANAKKVYEQPQVLGADPMDEEARSGYANSERSRVTMSCVLRYAEAHQPLTMCVENVVEAAKWGPNRDGSTFQWWLRELDKLGYETHPMFLNSVLFGVPQDRDRMFVLCWRKGMRRPRTDLWSTGWCPSCERHVNAFQWFRNPTKTWPLAQWGKLGKQYDMRCESCTGVVMEHRAPVANVLDFSDLGLPLMGLRPNGKPIAQSTIDRIVRYLEMNEYQLPFVTMTSQGVDRTAGWPVESPMPTVTTRHEQALIQAACQVTVYGNTMEREGSSCRSRSIHDPSWALHTTEAYGIAMSIGQTNGGWDGNRHHDVFANPSPTLTSTTRPELVGAIVPMRKHTHVTDVADPCHTLTAENRPALMLGAMWAKQNGQGDDTKYHSTSDPANVITAKDTTALVTGPGRMRVTLDDLRLRMLLVDELRRIMAYANDYRFAAPNGGEPSKRDKIRLLGDGVTPPVLEDCTRRLLEVMAA